MIPESRVGPGSRFTSNVVGPLVFVVDLACILASAPLALLGYSLVFGRRVDLSVFSVWAAIAGAAFFLIRHSHGAYSKSFAQLRTTDRVVAVDYTVAALLSSAIVWQLGKLDMSSRALTLSYVVICVALLFSSRYAVQSWLARFARKGQIGQRVVLYGADAETVSRTHDLLRLQALPQLALIGVADDRSCSEVTTELPFLGGLPELVTLARAGEVDQVFISLPQINPDRLATILETLSAASVDVLLIPREVVTLAPHYRVNFLGELPVLTLWQRPMRDMNRLWKRLEDLSLALIASVVLLPLLLLTAAAIKMTSKGPVLFKQRRFGFNNNEIIVYKFRSMYVDRQDISGAERTQREDPRVTPLGRILRKLSIDELPQLWNVLSGEMSLVGPRPHAVHMKVGDLYYLDAVRGYSARHRVKPGITGLAQVRGLRGEIYTVDRAKRRVELDLYYIDNWSLLFDLQIMLETVLGVAFDKNAY